MDAACLHFLGNKEENIVKQATSKHLRLAIAYALAAGAIAAPFAASPAYALPVEGAHHDANAGAANISTTDKTMDIVGKRRLTTLMITHNMRDALRCGNRLIMMYDGRLLIDVAGEEKKNLKVPDLLAMFEQAAGSELTSDSLLLS